MLGQTRPFKGPVHPDILMPPAPPVLDGDGEGDRFGDRFLQPQKEETDKIVLRNELDLALTKTKGKAPRAMK